MYNTEVDKKERRKIISVAVAAATLILVLVVAIIVVATNKPSENLGGGDNSTFTIEEGSEETEVSEEGEKTESESSNLGSLSTDTAVEEAPVVDLTPNEIASTGPEDVLPLALVLGTLTTVGTGIFMKRK